MTSRRAAAWLSAGLVALALAPATASAGLHATFDPAGNGTLIIQADYSDYVNKVALVEVTPSGGETDLVIGDVAAGIVDPLPPFCPRVDPTIIRCPLSMVHGINIDLGRGNDTVSAAGLYAAEAYDIQQLYIKLTKGKDVAIGAPASRNVIVGGPGRDMIMGGPLGDKLFGGGQNDFLVGQQGNDLLQCGKGDDRFNDGPGKDLVNVGTCEVRVHSKF